MKMRWIIGLGALLLVAALVVTGVGMAQAWGMQGGPGPWSSHMSQQNETDQQGHYGPGGMMGSGGMTGPGGMMGGYGNGQNQQNAANATPVSGDVVAIEDFAFQPANLQVKVGTTVTWTNKDTAPHTVTFNDSSLKSSGILRQGDTYTYTFTQTGTFAYYCDLHHYMTAQVVVTQ
ncbi:MAG: cupredoxin family copper-binding protein [Nitrososphaerota archaeon]